MRVSARYLDMKREEGEGEGERGGFIGFWRDTKKRWVMGVTEFDSWRIVACLGSI